MRKHDLGDFWVEVFRNRVCHRGKTVLQVLLGLVVVHVAAAERLCHCLLQPRLLLSDDDSHSFADSVGKGFAVAVDRSLDVGEFWEHWGYISHVVILCV